MERAAYGGGPTGISGIPRPPCTGLESLMNHAGQVLRNLGSAAAALWVLGLVAGNASGAESRRKPASRHHAATSASAVRQGTPSSRRALHRHAAARATAPATVTATSAGLRIAIDPATGRLVRPSPEQMRAPATASPE